MLSPVREGPEGSYLDLRGLFPPGIFAFFTLRAFGAGHGSAGLASFLAGLGYPGADVRGLTQVHSARVVEAAQAPCEADALLVRDRGMAGRILVADCVPVLLARRDGSACAAVHSGWKGTLSRIAEKAAEMLGEGGRHPLAAWIGPAIGPCCYAVPRERWERFREGFGPGWVGETPASPSLDLGDINRRLLLGAGVAPADLRREERCTACSFGLCWSYRRDGERAGRMAALIGRIP